MNMNQKNKKSKIMKQIFFLSLACALLLAGCSKKDSAGNNNQNNAGARISQIVYTRTNGNPSITNLEYDAQGRNKEWTYSNLDFSQQYTIESRILQQRFLLNGEGLVTEGYTQTFPANYRRKITYDGQKRITQVTIEEQEVNNSGNATTNYQLIYTYDFTWDEQNNVPSVKLTYSNYFLSIANTGGVKYVIYTYAGYSALYQNTLQPANAGLDFFGPYGYPSMLLEGGATGGALNGYFMGKQLPTAFSYQSFDAQNKLVSSSQQYTYQYEKDSHGRITMIDFGGGSVYRFSYQ